MVEIALVDWFDSIPALPWRDEKNPYRVWILEIMSQQTTLQTLMHRYPQWLDTFPELKNVAESSLENILIAWEGLGYYSRAKNIHKTAQILYTQGYPELLLRKWLDLPGVGHYTAAAILSQVYNLPFLAVDVNIDRIIRRYFFIDKCKKKEIDKFILILGEAFIVNPGKINQALIQLGQRLCRAKIAICIECPLQKGCASAFKLEKIENITIQKKILIESYIVLYIKNNKLLIEHITSGVGAGLYRLPKVDKNFWNQLACYSENKKLGSFQHFYTKYQDKLYVLSINSRVIDSKIKEQLFSENTNLHWIEEKDLATITFLSIYRKIINKVMTERNEKQLDFE